MAATQKGRGKQKRTAKSDTKEQLGLGQELFLLLILALCILLFLSGFGIGGRLTISMSEMLFGIFGFMAYIFPIVLFLCVFFIVAGENTRKMIVKVAAALVIFFTLCVFSQVLLKPEHNVFHMNEINAYYKHSKIFKEGGGVFGGLVYYWLEGLFGRIGSGILCVFLILLCILVLTRKSLFKSIQLKRREIADSAKKDSKQRKKNAEARKAEKTKRRQADMEFRRKEREIAYRAKEDKRKQYLADLEAQRKEDAAENKRRRAQAAENRRRQEENILQEQQRDAHLFDMTDLKQTGVQEQHTVRKTADNAASDAAQAPFSQEFTITRGGKATMYDLRENMPQTDRQKTISESAEADKQPAKRQKADQTAAAVSKTPSDSADAKMKPAKTEEKVSGADANKAFDEVAKEIADAPDAQEAADYTLPPLTLLQKGRSGAMGDSDEELRKTALKLQQTLKSFGVNVTILDVSCGPAVTRYELQPEVGVKVSRIVSLADDIKLNLAVSDIRIEAPIPGKPAVGIEVPNSQKTSVYLRELLESEELKKQKSLLAFPAGKDIAGKVIVADLAKMPHMLIAGTTGSGKSVFTNSIILSMLYRAKPSEVRFIIIDPKVVEFGVYNGIPHLMIPVVTDPKKAAGALNWAVSEMAERYKKFADLQVRDLKGYNAKVEALAKTPPAEGEVRPQKLPQIVIIIDELADLMMVAAKEVEDAICRLAQLARAAGIHMIIATQRPSVDVVTGLIKANIPSRVALSVASGIDSRTILDMNGAEKLLGNGDMLFYPSGLPKPIRVQGAFVSDQEVLKIVTFLKEQNQGASYDRSVEEKVNQMQISGGAAAPDGGGGRDEYFADAGKFIIQKDKASIGMLQRVFKVGFNRAARIMDQLCEAGVVGPEEGTKPRKILMSETDFENLLEEID